MEPENDQIIIFLVVSATLAVILFFVFRLFKLIFRKSSETNASRNKEREIKQTTNNLHDEIGLLFSDLNQSKKIKKHGHEELTSKSNGIKQAVHISDMMRSTTPIHSSNELRISVTTRNEPVELSKTTTNGLLDIYEILIQNTFAMGKATEVRAIVEYHPEFLYLTYFDNGKSNQKFNENPDELDLQTIHVKINTLNGTFEVREDSTYGFFATIRIPLIQIPASS